MRTIVVASALALAACGGGGKKPNTAAPPATLPAPVTQTIGVAGGTIVGPDGVTLTILGGALETDTEITIAAIDAATVPAPLPPGVATVGRGISLTPHGTTFGLPVTLSIPFTPAAFAAGETPIVMKTNGQGGWQQLVVEVAGDTLSAALTSFSDVRVVSGVDVSSREPVIIYDQPDDQTGFEDGFAFFRVDVGHAVGPVTYRWFRNGVSMPGETNALLLLPHLRLADDNSLYMVRVLVGPSGALFRDSRAARLLVTPRAPRIVNEPIDDQVTAGQIARFTAASTSSAAQTLQWMRCTPQCAPLANETATSLSFTAEAADDDARFQFCATNSGGTTCSRQARLSVIPVPVQPTISVQPQPQTVLAGESASFTVQALGGSLSYAWQHGVDGVNFTPHPTCGDVATCTLSNTTLADDATWLRVRVFNSAGSVTSANAQLTVRLNPGAVLPRVLGGNRFSVGLAANGTLRAWGANDVGQLGDGSMQTRADPVTVAGLSDVAAFAVGVEHTIALRANGEVWTWGGNDAGQLGDGTLTARATAQPVSGIGPARAAAANITALPRSVVVLTDGSVWSWGNNLYGQLGDGTTINRLLPVRAGTLSDVVRVSAGIGYTLALRNDGTVWAWGDNRGGQLGNGTSTASLVPVAAPMPDAIVAIAAGDSNALALTAQGEVLAWGFNSRGQVGDGTTERRLSPLPVTLPAPAISIAAGASHAMALLLDGRVFAWGVNADGQCGCGSSSEYQTTPCQVAPPLPADIVSIGGGLDHSLALAADGSVWAWGGTENDSNVPVLVGDVNLN